MATRDEILAEISCMELPTDVAAATIALAEFQNGLSVDQKCVSCGEQFEVSGLPPDDAHPKAWIVKCSCGESKVWGL